MRLPSFLVTLLLIAGTFTTTQAQKIDLSIVKAELCKKELLSNDFCNNKNDKFDILDIYQDMMTIMLEKVNQYPIAEEEGVYVFS